MLKRRSNFFTRVYKIVEKIPRGKVATYGQVAALVGSRDARKVGWALHANTSTKIPCHRVVNKEGMVAENFAFDGWREQKARLVSEGVKFISEKQVDLAIHRLQVL